MSFLIASFYKFVAYPLMRIYWLIFRPKTKGVRIVIQYKDQILLVKHTYKSNYWYLPGGGVGKKESVKQAAIREVKEELGIKINKVKNHSHFTYEEEHKKDTVWVFSTKVININYKIDTKEIKEAKWVRIKDLSKTNISPNTKRCLYLAGI